MAQTAKRDSARFIPVARSPSASSQPGCLDARAMRPPLVAGREPSAAPSPGRSPSTVDGGGRRCHGGGLRPPRPGALPGPAPAVEAPAGRCTARKPQRPALAHAPASLQTAALPRSTQAGRSNGGAAPQPIGRAGKMHPCAHSAAWPIAGRLPVLFRTKAQDWCPSAVPWPRPHAEEAMPGRP